jgi:hypothetical protein
MRKAFEQLLAPASDRETLGECVGKHTQGMHLDSPFHCTVQLRPGGIRQCEPSPSPTSKRQSLAFKRCAFRRLRP